MKYFLGLVGVIGLLMVAGALNPPDQADRDAESTALAISAMTIIAGFSAEPSPTATPDPPPTWANCQDIDDPGRQRDCYDRDAEASWDWERREEMREYAEEPREPCDPSPFGCR